MFINTEKQTNQFVKLDWTQVSLCCLQKPAQGRGRLSCAWSRITGRVGLAHGRIADCTVYTFQYTYSLCEIAFFSGGMVILLQVSASTCFFFMVHCTLKHCGMIL
jgi:hypothetical protein